MNGITIQELLINRGLDKEAKIKLVRHKDARVDLYTLYCHKKEEFLAYQSEQPTEVFKGVDYIVSFIGEEGSLSRFIGVYKIITVRPFKDVKYWYAMEEIQDFNDLREKVIVDWGKSTLAWHQWIANEKIVVQIHQGLHYTQFKDYFDVRLDFKQLQEIVTKPYFDWKKMLSVQKGVYLISDTSTGKLYVGSAYGKDGIWGRWASYVNTNGHGDNKTLVEIISNDPNYAQNFQFSILMILPMTTIDSEVISKESHFKSKLGKNACSLNNN